MKLFILALLIHGIALTSAQTAAEAPAPGPPPPTNITAVLSKAGQFTTFIRLLQNTEEADQINSQLNDTNNQMTILAPSDSAFSSLKTGLLNSFSEQQKVQMVQFHILPTFLSLSNFQTVSNPVRTQAGDGINGGFPLNVTTAGNQVNVTSGIVNTSLSNALYSDGQLAVYQVDQVLLPLAFFEPPPPAPAPETTKPKKKTAKGDTSDDSATSVGTSGTSELIGLQKTAFAISFAAAWLMFF